MLPRRRDSSEQQNREWQLQSDEIEARQRARQQSGGKEHAGRCRRADAGAVERCWTDAGQMLSRCRCAGECWEMLVHRTSRGGAVAGADRAPHREPYREPSDKGCRSQDACAGRRECCKGVQLTYSAIPLLARQRKGRRQSQGLRGLTLLRWAPLDEWMQLQLCLIRPRGTVLVLAGHDDQ